MNILGYNQREGMTQSLTLPCNAIFKFHEKNRGEKWRDRSWQTTFLDSGQRTCASSSRPKEENDDVAGSTEPAMSTQNSIFPQFFLTLTLF